jgi:glutathionyl-hydroquinone reductase
VNTEIAMGTVKKFVPNVGAWQSIIPSAEHPADPGRYHLYAGLFCPFAHRVLLTRELKGLQKLLPLSVVLPFPKNDGGWRFPKDASQYPGSTEDHLFHSGFLHEVYFRSPPTYKEYTGRYTVPVIWDKTSGIIVSNESEQISRFLNTAFNEHLDSEKKSLHFYPEHLRSQIDEINAWLVPNLNAGVYKTGHAPDQESYEENARSVYESLDKLENILAGHGKPYILGDSLTELDFKAYATLIRFDIAYAYLFKLNWKTIRGDYPRLNRYLKHLYWKVDGFKQTTNFKHMKDGYFKSATDLNPSTITPMGPSPDIEPWTDQDEKWLQSLKK